MSIFHPNGRLISVDATYLNTGVRRFNGNPFIEALPPIETKKADFLSKIANKPEPPTNEVRAKGEIVRIMEMATAADIVYPFARYADAGLAFGTILRESYVSRNPISQEDLRRRNAIATQTVSGLPLPGNWKSSAKSHFMFSHSGMGKTTFINASILRYPQVIRHSGYKDSYLQCFQVTYVVLRIPHNATLKSFCFQFFEEIDLLLGTQYKKEAAGLRQIAPMIILMNRVATTVSLGLVVVDELQNLRNATGDGAKIVLDLFSEILEWLGISMFLLGTPAVGDVLKKSVRNARKILSYGETALSPMDFDSIEWNNFCEMYWEYSYVKVVLPLTDKIRKAWYFASGGNTAFAALAFMLAQKNEIGSREIIDELAFNRAANKDMAFLQPAVAALVSRDPDKMSKFEDLIFSKEYHALRESLGVSSNNAFSKENFEPEEFDEEKIKDLKKKSSRRNSKKELKKPDIFAPPNEDPLSRSEG